MNDWNAQLESGLPCWADYRSLLLRLEGRGFPTVATLNRLLPPNLTSHRGAAIRFVAADELPGVNYELHIHETGQVSTRRNNWHDLFNALVWCRLPRLKVAMNTLHARHMGSGVCEGRGRLRDALTLLDESGALVLSSDQGTLSALANREWSTVFGGDEAGMDCGLRVVITGHALLEKFLRPYKSLTAKVLLVHVEEAFMHTPREDFLRRLDAELAGWLEAGAVLSTPAQLSPLPLMGLRGWWRESPQDGDFYADTSVFRPPPPGFSPAPVFTLDG